MRVLTLRMLDALILFYYSFVSVTDRATHSPSVKEVYTKRGIAKQTVQFKALQDKVGKKVKTMTQ